ncbi:MAG: FKBP-type peptidyl-prolyl cis-trans isomerase [Paludibacteraceae bacterium]|nr:FKBP-type peptidyl-prolyl cis-trans isomerase [Paludibacteraceae bacterium]
MKQKAWIIIALVMAMCGCKEDKWLDWKAENIAFMEQNKLEEGVIVSESGLQYKIIRQGMNQAGAHPDDLKTVEVTYTGKLINGYEFSSGENTKMAVSSLTEGFAEGLKKMYVSGRYILYVPYELAYKEKGSGAEGLANYIPPYSTLIFDVTLNKCY